MGNDLIPVRHSLLVQYVTWPHWKRLSFGDVLSLETLGLPLLGVLLCLVITMVVSQYCWNPRGLQV